METLSIIGIGVGASALALVTYGVGTYNWFKSCENNIEQLRKNISNQEDQRKTIIERTINSVVGEGTKFEKGTQTEIAKLRTSVSKGKSNININVENYPHLNATGLFAKLSEQLEEIEEKVTTWKQELAETIKEYNTAIDVIPTSIIANFCGFRKIQQK